MNRVKDELSVHLNYTNAQDHVPAEEENRTIKEAFRTALHRSGYVRIPQVMIEESVILCTIRLSWVPTKHCISTHYSPSTIVWDQVVDHDKHCTYKFGSFVQAHTQNAPTNVMQERTVDYKYLSSNANKQGSHILMNLNTVKQITRWRAAAVPLALSVKEKVELVTDNQGIKVITYAGRKFVKYDVIIIKSKLNCFDVESFIIPLLV